MNRCDSDRFMLREVQRSVMAVRTQDKPNWQKRVAGENCAIDEDLSKTILH